MLCCRGVWVGERFRQQVQCLLELEDWAPKGGGWSGASSVEREEAGGEEGGGEGTREQGARKEGMRDEGTREQEVRGQGARGSRGEG